MKICSGEAICTALKRRHSAARGFARALAFACALSFVLCAGSGYAMANEALSSTTMIVRDLEEGRVLPGPDEVAAFPAQAFELVNTRRTEQGLPALVWDEKLAEAAGIRAKECVTDFSHVRPGGAASNTVLQDVGLNSASYAENIASGPMTADEAIDGWMQSDGHRDNILRYQYGKIGIAVYQGLYGRMYWAQVFTKMTPEQYSAAEKLQPKLPEKQPTPLPGGDSAPKSVISGLTVSEIVKVPDGTVFRLLFDYSGGIREGTVSVYLEYRKNDGTVNVSKTTRLDIRGESRFLADVQCGDTWLRAEDLIAATFDVTGLVDPVRIDFKG